MTSASATKRTTAIAKPAAATKTAAQRSNERRLGTQTIRCACLALALAGSTLGGCTSASPQIDSSAMAEVSFDGLRKVSNTGTRTVYARPDLDISRYTKLRFVGADIEYRPATEARSFATSSSSSQSEYAISAENRDKLEALVVEEFGKELRKVNGFELADTAGPNTLTLEISLLDIVSRVPPRSQFKDVYLADTGAATLLLELRDSEARQTLIRTVERRRAGAGRLDELSTKSNPLTNWADIRRLAGSWARQMRAGLEDLASTQ